MRIMVWDIILFILTSVVALWAWNKISKKRDKDYEKKREITSQIGKHLHFYIKDSLIQNEKSTNIGIATPFTAEYILEYVKKYYENAGLDGEACRDEFLEKICDGVIPKKLYKYISYWKKFDKDHPGDWGEFALSKTSPEEYARRDLMMGWGPKALGWFLTGHLKELEEGEVSE